MKEIINMLGFTGFEINIYQYENDILISKIITYEILNKKYQITNIKIILIIYII